MYGVYPHMTHTPMSVRDMNAYIVHMYLHSYDPHVPTLIRRTCTYTHTTHMYLHSYHAHVTTLIPRTCTYTHNAYKNLAHIDPGSRVSGTHLKGLYFDLVETTLLETIFVETSNLRRA